jgi:hypothetical protein
MSGGQNREPKADYKRLRKEPVHVEHQEHDEGQPPVPTPWSPVAEEDQ